MDSKWIKFRREYLEKHPPSHEGYYFCHYCYKAVPKDDITLDHKKPRGSHPELKYDEDNIAFSCGRCNFKKGSRHKKY